MTDKHDHNHDHDHARTFQPDHPEPRSYHQLMGLALRELLIEKGHYTAREELEMIEKMSNANPGNGGMMVAKAWLDPDYKTQLLSDGNAAAKAVGIDPGPTEFTVLENTDTIHNVVVCTLCSCYPRGILGMSPAWYKSNNYRSRVVREPRKVLEEFDTFLNDTIEVRVHDSTAELRYMIMPQRPAGTQGWSEEALTKIVTRDSMIGVQRDLEIDANE